jgi:hypothetical protein
MRLVEITEENTPSPGEYIYFEPENALVLCGAYLVEQNIIRALNHGRYIEAPIEQFKKVELTREQRKRQYIAKCKGCGR